MRTLVIILVLFSVLQVAPKPSDVYAQDDYRQKCEPKYFTRIEVIDKLITAVNEDGKIVEITSLGQSIVVSPGEEIEEHLDLVSWNGDEADFKLLSACSKPACDPEKRNECVFKVKGSWNRGAK